MTTIIPIHSKTELLSLIDQCHENNIVCVLDFGASWCRPCQKLKKKLMENELPNLFVGYIDADDENVQELFAEFHVTLLPTQLFVKHDPQVSYRIDGRIEKYDWKRFVELYERP